MADPPLDFVPEPAQSVLEVVADAAPRIRGELADRRGHAGDTNVSGEEQLAADVWADEQLADRIGSLQGVGEYASEEREDLLDVGDGVSVAVDPLDGSSNLKSNNCMGTIVGVYPEGASLPAPGRDLVASAFVLYGPITTMVAAHDGRVRDQLVTADGLEVLDPDLTVPEEPVTYGFGGRVPDWTPAFRDFARTIEDELKLRYGGAMIADVNQVLTYGGVFSYPSLQSRPEGKLRLQFEANPMAQIVEAAGGASSDGERSLLDVEAVDLHQRTPVHLGTSELVDRLEDALAGERK
jgi:fructose-1,6-bisphosphatase I